MNVDSSAHPFCFDCGYDLSGLELPRPCPECGRLADPTAQAAEAREWFARRSSRLMWLVLPQRLPPGLWYVLSDPASGKLARRRVVRWLWLPAILAVVTVGVGCFITVDYNVRVWHYDQFDPERRPVGDVTVTETDRLFAFNFHFFRGVAGLVCQKQASWVQVVERQRKSVDVSVPESIDAFSLLWGCGPLLAVVFGYLPSSRLVAVWTRHRARRQWRVNVAKAAQTAWSVIAVPFGMAAWAWFLAVLIYGIGELSGSNGMASHLVGGLVWAALGWWVFVSLVGYGVLVRQDRARILVRSRSGLWAMVVILSTGGPAGVGWGILRFFP